MHMYHVMCVCLCVCVARERERLMLILYSETLLSSLILMFQICCFSGIIYCSILKIIYFLPSPSQFFSLFSLLSIISDTTAKLMSHNSGNGDIYVLSLMIIEQLLVCGFK